MNSPYVKYEILESLQKGNKIIGVSIGSIKDLNGSRSEYQDFCELTREIYSGDYIWFNEIIKGQFDYVNDNDYENLTHWIDDSFK